MKAIIKSIKPWAWLFGFAFAVLLSLAIIMISLSLGVGNKIILPTPEMVIIPAPTLTPVPPLALVPTVTVTPEVALINGVGLGVYVQITGTDGEGLRLRSAPGTGSDALFLGMDTEVFQVKDGPRMANDLVWWYIVAPYDETRAGWAAANYLEVVPAQP